MFKFGAYPIKKLCWIRGNYKMPSGLRSNLNSSFSFGVERAFKAKESQARNLIGAVALKRTEIFEGCQLSIGTGVTVSGSSHQVSGFSDRNMAASSSKAASADIVVDSFISSCGSISNFGKSGGVYYSNRSLSICQKASMSLGTGKVKSRGAACNPNHLFGSLFKSYNTSTAVCYSNGALPNVSHDGSSCNEQLASLAISDDKTPLGDVSVKLVSGSCYLPHPDKEATGGEDAHFICEDGQVVGVADGVGGWAEVGIDAGEYSRELMSNSVNAIQNEHDGLIDPARVLEKAYSRTNANGSSTACIILLKDQGLHAVNLGDSGFIVVRDGCTVFESPVQQHGFNFPYQLERGNRGDLPGSGQVFTIPIFPGDVIITGTDGLFDNLYNHEINSIVVNAMAAGFSPKVTAQKIAALARQRAQDRNRQTPFSTAAQEAGFTYYGGKLDDITVVVSYITSSDSTLSFS